MKVNKGLLFGVVGFIMGVVNDFIQQKQMEIAVEEEVNDILSKRGIVAAQIEQKNE